MNDLLEKIEKVGIVPVVTIEDIENAVPLAKALCEGGLPCAEVTFRTEVAKEAIYEMLKVYPNMIVGAGTVLNIEQVDESINAGAKFIVSPGLNPKVVKYCLDKSITIIPGCSNPSDIENAIELGLEVVKFFPAEAVGGLNMIKAMSAPYGNIKFMPTGGINLNNLNNYLEFEKVIACGGTWLANQKLMKEKRFKEIGNITKEAVNKMLGFELINVGINTTSEEEALSIANHFKNLFGFGGQEYSHSILSGKCINIMKVPFLGKNGQLTIGTNNINRAIWYLENKGYKLDEENKYYNENGELISIYLKMEIGGFAINLLKK